MFTGLETPEGRGTWVGAAVVTVVREAGLNCRADTKGFDAVPE